MTRVATFPIGIDPERFTRALDTDEVQGNIAKLLNRYAGRKIMLGVDRLDMVKGIPQKLLAYEKFLEEHPEWRDKVRRIPPLWCSHLLFIPSPYHSFSRDHPFVGSPRADCSALEDRCSRVSEAEVGLSHSHFLFTPP